MSSTVPATEQPSPRRLRILCLHGFTQNGNLFHAKTRALEKALRKAFPAPQYALSLVYPTAPIRIPPSDATGERTAAEPELEPFGWWRRKERDGSETAPGKREGPGFVYEGLETGLQRVAEYLVAEGEDGERGVDGVIGFSQGACLAGMLAPLLEPGRRERMDAARESEGGMGFPEAFVADAQMKGDEGVVHPPLKFAVSFSGFAPPSNPLYDAIYDPKISTPVMHFLGTNDTLVDEWRSMKLVDSCAVGRDSDEGKRRIVYHPGGHFVPSGKMPMANLVAFIMESMGWDKNNVGSRLKEELSVPFQL